MSEAPPTQPSQGHSSQRDLTIGPVGKTLFLFALPSLGVNILQSLNGSVNSVWIGQFLGEEALAASANAGMVMFLMFSVLFGFSMATTILIGQYMGRRDIESVRRIIGTAVSMFVIAGIFVAALGWFLKLDSTLLIGGMVWPPELAVVPALALGVSLGAALLPALGAYRVSVLELLQSR